MTDAAKLSVWAACSGDRCVIRANIMQIIDHGLDQFAADMEKLARGAIKVGILPEDAGTLSESGVPLIDYVIANEYGTDTIPARPAHRDAAETYQDQAGNVQEQQVMAVMAGRKSPTEALRAVGAWYQGVVQHHLLNGPWERNAASTIRKKGFDQPLIGEKLHFHSIKYKVEI